jgi:ABC-type cobalamin/Fe3+-siderophores transport system ATPase subunit
VKGSLKIEGDPNDVDAIIASLAATLGIDPALIVLDEPVTGRRAGAALEVTFTIQADPNEIEGLMSALEDPNLVEAMAGSLAAMGVNASVTPGKPTKEIPKRREGEVWELQESGENVGKYILRACYKGSLLVNATLDTQVRVSRLGPNQVSRVSSE